MLVLLLAGCQSAPQPANLPVDDLVSAFRQLDQRLSSGDLNAAEASWQPCNNAPPVIRAWSTTSANSPKRTCSKGKSPAKRRPG